jgi:hypothetical protein
MAFKGQYFIVKDGELRADFSNIKFTETRVATGLDACKETFGKITDDMFVKPIGVKTPKFMTFKKKNELMMATDGWISMSNLCFKRKEN